ncbi:MAG TPA: IniB N-terminal domain-containing protein [Acidimicrobiales bacterium]|nr:IniB N-terminal domain-containing protein [Acidimicrobiales bacterium]
MSVIDLLLDLFRSEEQQEAFAADPAAFLAEHAPDGLTADDVLAAMPGVCAALPPAEAAALRTAYGLSPSGSSGESGGPAPGSPGSPPPPPAPDPGSTPLEQVIQQINHYTNVVNHNYQSFEDNDTTIINDNDEIIDNSVNQNITAFGDVNQEFDNDVVTGDGNALGGDGSVVNSGDGAVQNTGIIADSTIATGDVGGSVTGDNYDSIVGDGNQVIDDSIVGAAAFGEGDATNVVAQNANVGDGTQVVGGYGETNVNTGDGDFTQIENSNLNESVVGDGTVVSNDVDIDADDGAAVAFGDGAQATGSNQDVDIDGNYGTVQVAGDHSNQLGVTDNSVNDSFNTEVDASTNDSFNDQSDDDFVDVDVPAEAPADEGPIEAV